jgi:phospholipid-translocating ATPase
MLNVGLRKARPPARTVSLNGTVLPPIEEMNVVRNTKYTLVTFIPVVLFNQFKYFFNLYFLLLALSQYIEPLSVGLRFSYTAPLELVIILIMVKEAYDDYGRYKRDKEANSKTYNVLTAHGKVQMASADL